MLSSIAFTKMHGLGNDFVVIDATQGHQHEMAPIAAAMGDRRRGIGFDQMLIARQPSGKTAEIAMEVYNSDGSFAEQCGNGLRCFARFVKDRGLVEGSRVSIETAGGLTEAVLRDDGMVEANLGPPKFEPREIPARFERRQLLYDLQLDGESLQVGAVSMGNPHAVLRVDDVDVADVSALGPSVQALDVFPAGVNVGFLQVTSRSTVRLRVFERGAGETQACGSGACAAVAVGIANGWLDSSVKLSLPGGTLRVSWAGGDAPVWLIGPAAYVFDGHFLSSALDPASSAVPAAELVSAD